MKEKQKLMEVLHHGSELLFGLAQQRITDYYLGRNEPAPVSPKYERSHDFKRIT